MNNIYKEIHDSIIHEQNYKKNKIAYILGGQPGCGKSSFVINNQKNSNIQEAISINGDDYRIFHPNYNQIASTDISNIPNQTQPFVNDCVEKLIDILSDENYNLIIEGTLRTSSVPQSTCEKLKNKGYDTNLIIIACDAETSWLSTLFRAENMAKMEVYPRFVPIEKYNDTVLNISYNLDYLRLQNCFDQVAIADRNGNILYEKSDYEKPSKILNSVLDIENWKQKYPLYATEFIKEQKRIFNIYNDVTTPKTPMISQQLADVLPSSELSERQAISTPNSNILQQTMAKFADLDLDLDDNTGTNYDYDFD